MLCERHDALGPVHAAVGRPAVQHRIRERDRDATDIRHRDEGGHRYKSRLQNKSAFLLSIGDVYLLAVEFLASPALAVRTEPPWR